MSTFLRSTSPWNRACGRSAFPPVLGLLVLTVGFAVRAQPPQDPTESHRLPLFLQVFRAGTEAEVVGGEVRVDSVIGPVSGYLARPATAEPLPALLIIADDHASRGWAREIARELAGIGYVALAADPPRDPHPDSGRPEPLVEAWDERNLVELSAAVRWLRRRPDVLPGRLGVVGWSSAGSRALALSACTRVEACVVWDIAIPVDPVLLAGLRETPLLALYGGRDQQITSQLPLVRKALAAAHIRHKIKVYEGVTHGFLGPPAQSAYVEDAAEQAWVEIYEFLGKHVEDVSGDLPNQPPEPKAPLPKQPVATIADIMRAVNAPTGVRGMLSEALEEAPENPQRWDRVRAHAALVAEAGRLLEPLTPPKGTRGHWVEQTRALTAAAETIVAAADRRDYAGAQRGLAEWGRRCAECHRQHR